jgi:hypothetical protein
MASPVASLLGDGLLTWDAGDGALACAGWMVFFLALFLPGALGRRACPLFLRRRGRGAPV